MSAGRLGIAGLLGVVVGLGLAAPAAAEIRELELDGGILSIKAGNTRDVIEVAAGDKAVTITDRDRIEAPGPPCEASSANVVSCPRRKVDEVVVDLGDANDRFDADGSLRFEVDGDSGDDEIDGGDLGDLLEGKFGDDRIDGSEGGDQILGGLDDDVMTGKGGKDLLDGGPGKDRGDGGAGKDKCIGVEQASKRDCS